MLASPLPWYGGRGFVAKLCLVPSTEQWYAGDAKSGDTISKVTTYGVKHSQRNFSKLAIQSEEMSLIFDMLRSPLCEGQIQAFCL